jgi:hypothetical protein
MGLMLNIMCNEAGKAWDLMGYITWNDRYKDNHIMFLVPGGFICGRIEFSG